ncbi:MAG: hypothetical protein JNJ54_03960 [Myxococcaceae bacterium]|nr:hypothetical protein [Myxococcaceae bacterium]
MELLQQALMVVGAVSAVVSSVSFQQALYFDGDPDAHWYRRGIRILAHVPRHPAAVKAQRRGWVLGAVALVCVAGVLLLRST